MITLLPNQDNPNGIVTASATRPMHFMAGMMTYLEKTMNEYSWFPGFYVQAKNQSRGFSYDAASIDASTSAKIPMWGNLLLVYCLVKGKPSQGKERLLTQNTNECLRLNALATKSGKEAMLRSINPDLFQVFEQPDQDLLEAYMH